LTPQLQVAVRHINEPSLLLRLGQACKIGTVPGAFASCGKPHNTLVHSSQGLQGLMR
jgi:hypothetical protein